MDFGCSSFSWRTEDNRHLLGRTYDQFGDLTANRVISVPRGVLCAPGLHGEEAVPGTYGYTGMAVLGFGEPILVDGVNAAGLMGALLHFPEYAVYQQAARPGNTAVHPGRLLAWLLSRCANVEEAVEEGMAFHVCRYQSRELKPSSAAVGAIFAGNFSVIIPKKQMNVDGNKWRSIDAKESTLPVFFICPLKRYTVLILTWKHFATVCASWVCSYACTSSLRASLCNIAITF